MDSIAEGEYLLHVGEAGARRLHLLNELYGPATEDLLDRAGIAPGMLALDVGCGIGTVTCGLAKRVGVGGGVVGIDISSEQLQEARRVAGRRHLSNVTFIQTSADDTALPRGSFDLVFCRMVLMHLSAPTEALREMRALLRPGGLLVCEEAELSSSYCCPPCEALRRFHDIAAAAGKRTGSDFDVGRRLYEIVRQAGFAEPEIALYQPVYTRGEAKHFEHLSFAEAAERVVAAGLVTADEARSILHELNEVAQDDEVVYAVPRMTQVWARR